MSLKTNMRKLPLKCEKKMSVGNAKKMSIRNAKNNLKMRRNVLKYAKNCPYRCEKLSLKIRKKCPSCAKNALKMP